MNVITRKAGTTDVSVVIRIIDSTDGTPETGVVFNTSGIDLEYRREGAVSTDITEATLSALNDAHSDGGFLHIGNGYYRLDLPDAAAAAGVTGVLIHGTVTGMVVIGCYIQLVTYDPFDSVRLGLTALPNAAANAAGGLPVSAAGALDLDDMKADINTIDDFLDTEIAAIKAKTDNLPADPADASDISSSFSTVNTKLDTIDDFLDTEIAALIASLNGIVLVSGTIGATGNDTTHLHLSGLAYADDGINSMLLSIKDVSTGLYYSRWIEDFANTGDLATVATLPFTPEASVDLYWILPVRADVTGGSGLDAAGVRAAVGLASANLDTQLSTIDDFLDTEVAAIKAKTDNLPSDPADASDIASSFTTVNGKLDTIDDFLDTEIAAIKAKTDNLPSDPADQSALEAILGSPAGASLAADIAAIEAQTDDIGAAGAGLTALATQVSVNTIDDFLDTEIAAIKAKTDNLPSDPADASDIASSFTTVNGKLDTIDDFLDTEIAAIKAKTDNLPSDPADDSDIDSQLASIATKVDTIDDFLDTEVAAIKAKTDSLTFTQAGKVDANLTHINETEVTGDGDATPWGPV